MAAKKKPTKRPSPLKKLVKAVKRTVKRTVKKASPPAKRAKRAGTAKKRERIDTTPGRPGGSRYVRRAEGGRFGPDQVDVGRSLTADRRHKAKTTAEPGMKDQGD